jgi:O-antigen ligase
VARTTRKRRASGQVGAAGRVSRRAREDLDGPPSRIAKAFGHPARWDSALAVLAWLSWFAGHVAGPVSDIAIPAWVITGLALGLLRPRFGLLVTVLVVPYVGGATDQANGEVLRVIPILGASVRVAVDRLRGIRSLGAPRGEIVALAFVAAGLFLLTTFTAFSQIPHAGELVLANLPWLLGAPVAFLAAWIAAAHDGELPDGPIVDAILISTTVACLFAIVAWWGATWTAPFAFPVDVSGRLAALGYPTPTGIGVAIALPFAVAAARRRHILAGIAVLVLGLVTVVLTGSRGPLIALGVGGFVAVAVSGRLRARTTLAGVGIAIAAAAALVAVKYGTTPQRILDAVAAVTVGDTQRVQSWRAAIEITLSDPLTGGGWRSLSRVPEFGDVGIAASHNLILNGFADGGLPLGLSFGGVVLYSAVTMWSNRRWIAPYAIAAATTLLVTGLWDIPNLRSYGAVMGGLALGLVARNVSDPATQREPRGAGQRRMNQRQG